MPHNKKSTIKRIGVKSAFSHGNSRLTITQFGRGNTADIAVETDSRGRSLSLPHRVEKSFTVNKIDDEIDVQRSSLLGTLLNPAENDPVDYLGLKSTLEKEFFGQEFPNDSIRIQIIHNILDIQKILGIYINDVLYSIANLQNVETVEDCLGQSLSKGQDEKLKKILNSITPYLGFLGAGFKQSERPKHQKNSRPDPRQKIEDPNWAYNKSALRILSTLRNKLAHFEDSSILFCDNLKGQFLGSNGNWITIETHYDEMITRINESFFNNSRMNLKILYLVLNAATLEDKKKITEEYYRFSILKEGKNLGVNMRKLREMMVDMFYSEIKDKQYDSYRQKIYTILDFLLFREIKDSEELETMVADLRESESDEKKEELYHDYAELFWDGVKDLIVPFFAAFDGDFTVFTTEKVPADTSKEPFLSSANTEPLVKLLAFLCNFWDGKEVNEVLSAYIHKFESIQAFIDVLESKELNEKVVFSAKKGRNFSAFNEHGFAGRVADQLRVLASIGKMKPDLESAKRALFRDAVETLGIVENSNWLNEDGTISNDWLETYVLPGDKVTEEEKRAIKPFRNFIANNVIESRRFMYLARYAKPKSVRELMKHEEIIRYVLTRLPEKQIDTYFSNISEGDESEISRKIDTLTKALTGFSFNSLFINRDKIVENTKLDTSNKNVKIERLKALTGLYLTVAFVAVKNLVKANARYFIAFSAFERDYGFMKSHDPDVAQSCLAYEEIMDGKSKTKYNEIYALTEYYLKKEEENDYHPEPGQPFDKEACRKHLDSIRRHFTKKWRDIFRKEIDEAVKIHFTGYLGVWARNQSAHLNVLTQALPQFIGQFARNSKTGKTARMTSYFQLYHYLLQRLLCEDLNFDVPEEWKNKIQETGLPCNDLIHICFVPLGYNLPRYKNLTIECLFDEDSVSAKEGKKA
ncbi:MAG: type VI-D CRISPR-associated RNA-guided ribonuclease Cas13d [Thermoguttaceae bacterium]|nr:type VI-D CRISPR-associated RNA-guided ribonuclease Cas13d [Thermoguttaceae bacterium]